MTDTNPTMLDLIVRHRKAVEAFLAFSSIHPIDDDLHPLVELLSANLEDSFRGIYPHLCGLDSCQMLNRGFPSGFRFSD